MGAARRRGWPTDVVLNLVDYAVKYTPARSVVRVSALADGGAVALEVSDTGVGIPADVGDHVFDAFYRVAVNTTQAGQPSTALGLALTRQLVHAHGGTISYSSELGRGTSFRVTVPAAGQATADRDASSADDGQVLSHPPTQRQAHRSPLASSGLSGPSAS